MSIVPYSVGLHFYLHCVISLEILLIFFFIFTIFIRIRYAFVFGYWDVGKFTKNEKKQLDSSYTLLYFLKMQI